ncbi:MAG: hypothetical protein KC414_14185, partial [Romboutsia sp.]|nr:hypothetical protein [Romboutsia sp.]
MLAIVDMWILGIRTKDICSLMQISKKSLWKFFKKIPVEILPKYYAQVRMIGGDNVIVEIDESKFGRRKYHTSYCVEGVWIFGMVERTEERRIVLIAAENRTAETLTNLTRMYID